MRKRTSRRSSRHSAQWRSATITNTDTSSTSHTIDMPAERPNGDLYVLILINAATVSTVTLSGWTQEGPNILGTSGVSQMRVYWRFGSSEPATYSLTLSAARRIIAAVVRVAAGQADLLKINQRETTGDVICPEIQPRQPNSLILYFAFPWMSAANDRLTSGPDFNVVGTTTGLQLAGHHITWRRRSEAPTYAFTQDVGTSQRIAISFAIAPKTKPTGRTLVSGRPRNWPILYAASTHLINPSTSFGVDANSATLVSNFYNNGMTGAGNFNAFDRSFTYPIYFRHNATVQYLVTATNGNMNGQNIWWNPSWEVPGGTDNQFIVYDMATGEEINAFQGSVNHAGQTITCTRCNRVNTENTEGALGTIKSFLTANGQYTPSRGCGIAYGWALITPEEIERGCIGHALSVPSKHTLNTFRAPATKSDGSAGNSIEEGTHYNLLSSDSTIESAVAALPSDVSAGMRRMARIVYRALRDHGWYITDTSGSAHLQFEANQSAEWKWRQLGVWPAFTSAINFKEYPRDMLDHIFTGTGVFQALAP